MELSDSTFTVVVANDDEDGLLTRDLSSRWFADGLLDEFAWVTPEDVATPAFGPATIMATVLGSEQQVELMTLLGTRPRSLIRIVVLHLLTHEHSNAERLVNACNQIAGLVKRAMPVTVGDGDRHAMRLLRINLMVPESDLMPQTTDIIEPGWEVNAIVSPEDRPDLDRLSVFVRKSVNLHGHALGAAASVGGLWSGSRIGAFDHRQADSTSGGHELVVIRCQTRMIVGDDGSASLANKVAEVVQGEELGPTHVVAWGVPADNPAAIVDASVKRLLEGPEWAPQERRSKPLEKAQVSLGTLIQNWALFQLQLPVSVIRYLLGKGRGVVEEAVTAATVGRGAGEIGRVRPLTPQQAEQVAEFRMKKLSNELDPLRLQEEASRWGQTTPTAWRELRELAVGLVDGSPLPSRFTRTNRGGLDEVLDPAYVVPPPNDPLPIAEHRDVGGLDVERVAEIGQKLAEAEGAQQSKASAGADLATSEVGKGEPPAARAQTEEPDEEHEPTKTEILASWVERRQPSLMWQLATRVYDFRRRERAQAQAAHSVLLNTTPPGTGRLKSAQLLVILSWVILLLGLLLLGLWAWASARQDLLGFIKNLPELNWKNITKLFGSIVLALLAAGTFYFQALRAYEWQVLQRMYNMRQAADEYVAARREDRRWELMYRGLQDWGSVFAELLHRPWAAPASISEQRQAEYVGLPAAVAVAVPVDTNEGPDPRVVARSAEAICQRGWLEEEFSRILAESPSNDPAAQRQSGDFAADLDLGLRVGGPRSELVKVASNMTVKQKAWKHLQDEVVELIDEHELVMPPRTVTRIGPYSAGDSVVDRDYLIASNDFEAPLAPELFGPEALVERVNLPEHVVFSLPVGAPKPRLSNAEVHYCGRTTAARVDVTPALQARAIKLFVRSQTVTDYVPAGEDDFN